MTKDAYSAGGWHVARGECIDTTVVPRWLRTGYVYFPYAAWESGHSWVLRVNWDFPEHDMFTVFIDGRPVAEATAGRADLRPLVASFEALPIDGGSERYPVMPIVLAAAAIGRVSSFVEHGAEWGEPCIWCTFAERDPYRRISPDPHPTENVQPTGSPVIRVEYVKEFRNQDVVLAAMNAEGVAALWGAMTDAHRTGGAQLYRDGVQWQEIVVEPGAAGVESFDDRVRWRLDIAKVAEISQKLGVLLATQQPGHHYVDDMCVPAQTVVLSRDEYV